MKARDLGVVIAIALCGIAWMTLETDRGIVASAIDGSVTAKGSSPPPSETGRASLEQLDEPAAGRASETVESSPAPVTLSVHCRDANGGPVPDARILVGGLGAEFELAGRSDDTGRAIVRRPGRSTEVIAIAEGIGSGQAWVVSGQQEVTLTLESGRISGKVHRADCLPLEAPVTVLAVPRHLAFRNDLSVLQSRADVFSTETTLTGDFVLDGLPNDSTGFLLHCGGSGWFCRDQAACNVGTAGVEMELIKAFAAVLELACPTCSPAELAAMGKGRRLVATGPPAQYGQVDRNSLGMALAGYKPLPEVEGIVRSSFFYGASEDKPSIGWLSVEALLPGFGTERVGVECFDVGSGIKPVRINMRRVSGEFGELVLVDRGRALLPSSEIADEVAQLILESSTGAQIRFSIPDASPAGEAVIQGIPHGVYGARIRRHRGLATYPEVGMVDVEIGPAPARIEIDAAEMSVGDVEIRVLDPDGNPYLGTAHIYITPKPPEEFEGQQLMVGLTTLRMRHGPYVIPSLGEGDWYVKMMFPHKSSIERIDVVAGSDSAVLLNTTEVELNSDRKLSPKEIHEENARLQRFMNRPR